MALGTMVSVAAGLYYGLGSILLFNKLTGGEEYDVIVPTSGNRPRTDAGGPPQFGLLSFQAGLHEIQHIPDSGWAGTDRGAWTIKIPWETHMRRNQPPEELYDPEHPYWNDWAEQKAAKLLEKHMGEGVDEETALHKLGVPTRDALVAKSKPQLPLPRSVMFELHGEWWDTNWSNTKIDDFTILFIGREDFVEVTLAEMRQKNEGGTTVDLEVDGAQTRKENASRPVYFDLVQNPYGGVTSDWALWYQGPLTLVPRRTSVEQLKRWFDYENPDEVNLKIDGNPSDEQELDYEWF